MQMLVQHPLLPAVEKLLSADPWQLAAAKLHVEDPLSLCWAAMQLRLVQEPAVAELASEDPLSWCSAA